MQLQCKFIEATLIALHARLHKYIYIDINHNNTMRPLAVQTKRSYEADNYNRENEHPSITHHRTPVSNWKYSAASAKSKLDEILRGIDQLNTEAFNADNNATNPPLSPQVHCRCYAVQRY